jgi:hypothetical protein
MRIQSSFPARLTRSKVRRTQSIGKMRHVRLQNKVPKYPLGLTRRGFQPIGQAPREEIEGWNPAAKHQHKTKLEKRSNER